MFGVAPAIVQWAHYVAYVQGKMLPWPSTTTIVFLKKKEDLGNPKGMEIFSR